MKNCKLSLVLLAILGFLGLSVNRALSQGSLTVTGTQTSNGKDITETATMTLTQSVLSKDKVVLTETVSKTKMGGGKGVKTTESTGIAYTHVKDSFEITGKVEAGWQRNTVPAPAFTMPTYGGSLSLTWKWK